MEDGDTQFSPGHCFAIFIPPFLPFPPNFFFGIGFRHRQTNKEGDGGKGRRRKRNSTSSLSRKKNDILIFGKLKSVVKFFFLQKCVPSCSLPGAPDGASLERSRVRRCRTAGGQGQDHPAPGVRGGATGGQAKTNDVFNMHPVLILPSLPPPPHPLPFFHQKPLKPLKPRPPPTQPTTHS